jgi:hypothetical protein
MMIRILAAAFALTLAGCGLDKADEFRKGVPKSDAVTMKLPDSKGAALSGQGTRRDGLEGDIAGMYQLTRGVTVMVNGGGGAVLALVKAITDQPPTSMTATTAVWGPGTDALSPNTYRMTVTKNATDNYSYVLEGRGKNEADSAFRAVLSGSHVVTGQELGSGTFMIDWNASATLPEHDADAAGGVVYGYSHTSAAAAVQIDAVFTQVKDKESGKLVEADYKYAANPGAGGNFEFKIIKDMVPGAALETATVKSRWEESGAGRSDLKVAGGDVPGMATANECWDSNFASKFMSLSYAPTAGWGAESACAFATAEYPIVSP